MINAWQVFFSDRRKRVLFFLLVFAGIASVMLFSKFMIWNETRSGVTLNDPILLLMDPVNLSRITMSLTLVPILVGMLIIFMNPRHTVHFFYAAIFICVLRSLSMLFVPLDPPVGIIPLTDPVIENLFYGGHVLEKDLFFSGHTANIILIGLILGDARRRMIYYVIAAIVGTLLMWQRVHYSIDVFAAPFFAYLAYQLSVFTSKYTLLRHTSHDEILPKITNEAI